MRFYLELVKDFTSLAVFHRRPKFPGTTIDAEEKLDQADRRPGRAPEGDSGVI
jgi:hypothetical protein